MDDRPCGDCGNENPVWFADNEVWNAVFPETVGYICPNCFIKRADPVIRNTGWRLVPDVGAHQRVPEDHIAIQMLSFGAGSTVAVDVEGTGEAVPVPAYKSVE